MGRLDSGRRRLLSVAVAIFALVAATGPAAQGFPSKPIEFVVHSGAGGGPDLFVRAVSEIMAHERLFQQPLTVSNRTGGGGSIAFNYVKSKHGDPHIILGVGTGTLLTMAARPDLEYGLENYTPLAFMALDAQVIAVAPDSKFKTLKDLIEAGKREPNAISCAVASATGFGRVVLYAMERDMGAKFKYVSFKSGTEAALAVVGGHVPFTTENVSETAALVDGKKLRVLAVTGDKRMSAAPDAPTLKELGYPLTIGTGRGFAMPAGVTRESAATMETALKKVHDSAAWKDFAARNMYEDTYLGAADFSQYLVKHREEMRQFLIAIGLIPKS